MEESVDLLPLVMKSFALKEVDIRSYSPLALTYIGDGVFDLVIRTVVVERGNAPVSRLHHSTASYVRAATQAAMIEALLPELTQEELAVYRRGRNAKPHTSAKNASLADYLKATGLEALIGYLYLLGRTQRLIELIKDGLEKLEMKI